METIFEAGPQLTAAPAATLDTLRRLGVDRVRVYVRWSSLAPDPSSPTRPAGFDGTDPAQYAAANWAPIDTVIRLALARRMTVDVLIGGPPPLWASGPGSPQPALHPQWRPSAAEYGALVQAVGRRYSGSYRPPGSAAPLPRVDFWSIWNEPNYGPDLAPQATDHSQVEVSPLLYRDLLDAAWGALAASGHGGDTVLIGETAPRGITVGNQPGNFSGMVPLRFVRALYCVDAQLRPLRGAAAIARGCPPTAAGSAQFPKLHPALFQASGFADHPYPQGRVPPNVPTPGEPDYADLPALPRLEQTLDQVFRAYGSSRRIAIYDTEFGYQTDPPETIERAIDPRLAAVYINWSEYLHWRDPRVRSFDQYLLEDPPNAGPSGGFASGLEFKGGTPKPTLLDAFRLAVYLPVASGRRGQSLEVWGCVRPARYAQQDTGRTQHVEIQFKQSGASAFKTVKSIALSDPYGYFDVDQAFPASGALRLAWSYPGGPAIFSRTVLITLR